MLDRKRFRITIRYSLLIGFGLVMIYPLVWLFTATFKENYEIFSGVGLWPKNGFKDWDNWLKAVDFPTGYSIWRHFANTLRFVVPRTVFTVISSTLVAYAVARFHFRGKKIVFACIIATLLMPDVIFRVPLYLIWRDIGLLDSYVPLYLGALFGTNSFFIFMMIQFFRTIPRQIDDAARIDGAGYLQILWYILIPVMKPVIITVALLTFMWGLNDFMGPLIYITSPEKFPLSVALRTAISADQSVDYGQVYAMSFLALLPAVIVFAIAQKYFVEGIATSGLKE